MKMKVPGRAVTAVLALTVIMSVTAGAVIADDAGYGVYEYVVEQASGTLDEIAGALEEGAAAGGWKVLAGIDAGVPDDCTFRARVLVLYDSLYASRIISANPETGPFAALDRVTVFEDENGVHVSVVNPHSINRTILMDDSAYEEMTETHLVALREMIASAVEGTPSTTQYGQFREEGYIGTKWFLRKGPADGPQGVRDNVAIVAAAREASGDDMLLMVDAWNSWDVPYTVKIDNLTAEYDVHWI